MRICVLPGDGIGPEVTEAALRVLAAASSRFGFGVELDERPFGGAAIDAGGHPFPDATREACLGADAVLLGAVGGPRWNTAAVRPEQGLLALRSSLGCYANVRPARRYTRHTTSPLRDELVADIDLVIVRELIGGIYFGERELGDDDGLRHVPLQRVRDPPHRRARVRHRRAPRRPPHERRQGQRARDVQALAPRRDRRRRRASPASSSSTSSSTRWRCCSSSGPPPTT